MHRYSQQWQGLGPQGHVLESNWSGCMTSSTASAHVSKSFMSTFLPKQEMHVNGSSSSPWSQCPQCGSASLALSHRLVRETCGHLKCRECLLREHNGCQQCRMAVEIAARMAVFDSTHAIKTEPEPTLVSEHQPIMEMASEPEEMLATSLAHSSASSERLPTTEELATLHARVVHIRQWIKVCNFGLIDHELEHARHVYTGRIHDGLVNVENNSEIIERGKERGFRLLKLASNEEDSHPTNDMRTMTPLLPPPLTPLNRMSQTPSQTPIPNPTPNPTPMPALTPTPTPTPIPTPTETPTPSRRRRRRHLIDHTHYSHILKKSELDPPEYQCTICNRQFKNRLNIRYHIACADASAGHACTLCPRIFKSSSHLTYHMRTAHDAEKPYKCEICLKRFAQSVKLKRHMRTHTGERPFKCNVCNHAFTTKYNLKEHENIHKGHKPHVCKNCKKAAFADRNNLRRHEATCKASGKQQQSEPPQNQPLQREQSKRVQFEQEQRPQAHLEHHQAHLEVEEEHQSRLLKLNETPVREGESQTQHDFSIKVQGNSRVGQQQHQQQEYQSPAGDDGVQRFMDEQASWHQPRGNLGVEHRVQCQPQFEKQIPLQPPLGLQQAPQLRQRERHQSEEREARRVSSGQQLLAKDTVSLSKSVACAQIKTLLQSAQSDIYKIIDTLSSTERRTLIDIMSHDESGLRGKTSTRNNSSVSFDKIDGFSDISTGSKKEFLRRYKKQVLGLDNSTASSSISLPSAANSISAWERQQLMLDDFKNEEWNGQQRSRFFDEVDFPKASIGEHHEGSALADTSFEHIMQGIHNVISRHEASVASASNNSTNSIHIQKKKNNDSNNNDEGEGVRMTDRGLRKLAVCFDEEEDE